MSLHSNHPYHLVEKSPWPLIASVSALMMVAGLVKWFHDFKVSLFLFGVVSILLVSAQWWRDTVREAAFQGLHTLKVAQGMRWGMVLFIVSELLFFFSFFWAYFHSSLSPTSEIGAQWPPASINGFNPFQIPLLNTAILLASGVTVTWAHHAILENEHSQSVQGLLATVLLGGYFTFLQAFEYSESAFSIGDSVYGATFFVATGFHGLHVIIGSTFLCVNLWRLVQGHFSSAHHNGVEAAIWYWHFVDVVWLFLYVSIYWWGY
ncbi:cytochrome c oxidase subunit III (mitochondrion) [Hyalella azteca]|uniref:Cytochrome c oxidase subunit 3 n=1 Tax=Hyalella azteca TaxID=294128 RepID=A0A385UKV0_HYAAZ|nr:cytochrome c oxidase subunit III [Hyalella azteca]AYB71620.1 cytochrome oxidase subunit 3 [Hyalella azteca]